METADTSWAFEGFSTARKILTVRSSGRVFREAISYGEIEIERGANVIGMVRPLVEQVRAGTPARPSPAADRWLQDTLPGHDVGDGLPDPLGGVLDLAVAQIRVA